MKAVTIVLGLVLQLAGCSTAQNVYSSGVASVGGATSFSGGTASGGATSANGGTSNVLTCSNGTPEPLDAGALPSLHVEGRAICDSRNNVVVLRGAATIDVGSPYNWRNVDGALQQFETSIDLVTGPGWKTRVVRIPVYGTGSTRADQPNNFPEGGPQSAQDLWFDSVLKPSVDYATRKDLYVIIDWHEISSAAKRDEATQKFWSYLAPKLANVSNVLYEVFNEDSDQTDWAAWQPLAQGWVDIIRSSGANNLILVGGPSWAQTIGGSARNPVMGGNIAYVAHVYCSHYNGSYSRGYIASQMEQAAASAPIFITEWGFSKSDENTTDYVNWLKNLAATTGASWTAWVISPSWGPPLFNADKTVTAFGQATKDWLAQY